MYLYYYGNFCLILQRLMCRLVRYEYRRKQWSVQWVPHPAGQLHREHHHRPVRPSPPGGLGPGQEDEMHLVSTRFDFCGDHKGSRKKVFFSLIAGPLTPPLLLLNRTAIKEVFIMAALTRLKRMVSAFAGNNFRNLFVKHKKKTNVPWFTKMLIHMLSY